MVKLQSILSPNIKGVDFELYSANETNTLKKKLDFKSRNYAFSDPTQGFRKDTQVIGYFL